MFFVYYNFYRSKYRRWSHWFYIHIIIFPGWFYLITVTSRNTLPSYEHDPSYQYRSQSNLVKAFIGLYCQVLTGFKHNFKNQLRKMFYKKKLFSKISNINRKRPVVEYLFNKFMGLQAGNVITKRLQHRYFPVNIAKFLKTSILKDICERRLLNFIDSKWKK